MRLKLLTLLLLISYVTHGQVTPPCKNLADSSFCPIKLKHLIVPTLFIGYGFWGLDNGAIVLWNNKVRDQVTKNIDEHVTIDNFTQYAPLAAAYTMHMFGKKGFHNTKDLIWTTAFSYTIMAAMINPIKNITKIRRPDGSSLNSFPSGHTATAFAGAEVFWREYHHDFPILSYSAYGVAAFTGIYRVRNNRHWVSDILTGAGIGILSTKLAYCLYPTIRKIFKKEPSVVILPQYYGDCAGATLSYRF